MIEGLSRKYKLSKISDNIVLSKEEYELCKLLDKYFTNLKKMVERCDINENRSYYFNQENVLILDQLEYDVFNDDINACVNRSIFDQIYKYVFKMTVEDTREDISEDTYYLIREWLGEEYTYKNLYILLDLDDCTEIYDLLNNKKLKLC